uniref:Uncharacterized protein n=1 Tax=Anguilla anguilla TaxID=7936 RepID=A0A0E9TWE9_ANGAN
MRQQTLFHQL